MAGWPSIERAEDGWLAESLGSDRAASARLYDLYAARLFDYCHVLLRDEQAASGALLDSLLAVREHGGDPRSFRGRLYAVTREECLRRRADPEAQAGGRRAAEAADEETDEASRRLVHAALLALSGRQREVLDLSLRHGLSADDLAPVLHTTPDDAAAFLVRARRELDDAFAAVLVVTTGRDDCPSVSSLAGPPGSPLDARTCGVVARHIGGCPICGTRGDLEVPTARLLDAMPVAALPNDLRERFLAATADPWFADVRPPVAARAEAPARRHERSRERPRTGPRLWPVAAGIAFATLMAGGTFYALSGTGGQNAGNDQAMPAGPGGLPPDSPSASDSSVPLFGRAASGSPSPTPSASSGTPTPTPTPGHRTPETTPVSVSSDPPSRDPGPPRPPAPGTLVATGCTMHSGRSCTVTVTASGGPVSWSVTGTSGGVSASGGGNLAAGESAGVTATRSGGWCWGHHSGSVSFSGGASASVDWYC